MMRVSEGQLEGFADESGYNQDTLYTCMKISQNKLEVLL